MTLVEGYGIRRNPMHSEYHSFAKCSRGLSDDSDERFTEAMNAIYALC